VTDLIRCPWCGTDPVYVAYHDEEWGVPVHDDRTLFEYLCLEGAEAGLSWITVLKKRPRYREVFDGFDIAAVAAYDAAKVEALLSDPGIIRSRAKVTSHIHNARMALEVQAKYGSLGRLPVAVRGRPTRAESVRNGGRAASRDAPIGRHEPSAEAARLQLRREPRLLCVHAGGGHGERSPGVVLPL
jgi:DNA-3-methyladenine glycosylase I